MRVVIAPTSPLAGEVFDRLVSWSRSGLLEPFCWWPTPIRDDPSADAPVRRVTHGVVAEESLSAAIDDAVGGEETRLVAFYPAPREEPFDVEFTVAVMKRTTLAAKILPFRPGEPVRTAMVVAPASVGQHVPPGLFRSHWATNVLVAPEDRSGPQSSNVLADTSTVFPGHAAHAIATVADLWSDPRPDRQLVLDAIAPAAMGDHPVLVVPVRTYSRVVDLGYLPDHVAAEVFRPENGSWPNPDRHQLDRVEDPTELLTYVTRRYLGKHEDVLGLTPFEDGIQLPPRPRLSILDALRWLWEELVRTIKRKPFEIADGLLAAAVDRAADWIESRAGADRPFDVKRWRDRASKMVDFGELCDDLQRPLIPPDGPVAATWSDLLDLAFGLVDGSELPSDLDADALKINEKRLVVTEAARIVPDPARRPPPSEAEPNPRACDPRGIGRRVRSAIPAGDNEVLGDDDALDPKVWVTPHAATPLWIVGQSIASAIASAEATAAQIADELQRPSAEEQAVRAREELTVEKKQRRRRRLRLLFGVGAPVVLALLASWAVWTTLSWPIAIPAQFVVFVLILASFVTFAKRQRAARYKQARDDLHAELVLLNRSLERSLREGDKIRLQNRYAEYLDWVEVIGWLVHQPWVGEALKHVDVRSPIDVTTLPAAMEVAVGRTDERVAQLRKQTQARLFRPGWLSDLYRAVEESVMEDLRRVDEMAQGDVAVARRRPVADTSRDPESDRNQLRDAVRAGRYRHLTDNTFCAELLTVLDGLPIDLAADGVVELGDDEPGAPDPLPPATAWFSPPDDLADMVEMLQPAVVRITHLLGSGQVVGGSGVVITPAGLIATARHVVEGADGISVEFADGTTATATIVRTARDTDLAVLFVPELPHGVPAATVASVDDRPEQGDPVVTLGHPLLQEGEATLAWGLITATDRQIDIPNAPAGIRRFAVIQATYASAGGHSGAPVFDLDGRLVGIHSAGSIDIDGNTKAQYLSSAVPIDALHALLAASGDEAAGANYRPATNGSLHAARKPEPDYSTPTAFLGELVDVPEAISFLPDHWVDPTRGRPRVQNHVPASPNLRGDGGRLKMLAGPTAFLQPIRASVHRVELTGPVPPSELRSCTDP